MRHNVIHIRNSGRTRFFLTSTSVLLLHTTHAFAQPAVPNVATTLYSQFNETYFPFTVALNDAGFLYVASGDNSPGGATLRRVPPGGGAPVTYANGPIYDPDGIIVDRAGSFSGVPGAVLVASQDLTSTTGHIRAVRPDGSIFSVVAAHPLLDNNDSMVFDSAGRLIINVSGNSTVVRFVGGSPQVFISVTDPNRRIGMITIDDQDRLWTSCVDGAVRRYSASGTLEATIPVGSEYPGIGYSSGGLFPAGVYVINNSSGELSRVNAAGTLTSVGTGFTHGTYHMVFDARGILFAPEWMTGRIYRLGCAADFNQDGVGDFFDYLDFVDAFSTQLPSADFNHDSVVDFFDYLDFVDVFSHGC